MKGVGTIYSEEEVDFVRQNRKLPRSELHTVFVQKFNRPDVSSANLIKLRLRNGWLTGRSGKFKKGHVPSENAGAKGPNKRSFKPGNRPYNWVPVFSTRISKDGYLEIKTKDPRTWGLAHIILWEKYHGKVPPGFCVSFKNGIKSDISLGNLEMISRTENLRINGLGCSSCQQEMKPTVRSLGKLIALTQGLTR